MPRKASTKKAGKKTVKKMGKKKASPKRGKKKASPKRGKKTVKKMGKKKASPKRVPARTKKINAFLQQMKTYMMLQGTKCLSNQSIDHMTKRLEQQIKDKRETMKQQAQTLQSLQKKQYPSVMTGTEKGVKTVIQSSSDSPTTKKVTYYYRYF